MRFVEVKSSSRNWSPVVRPVGVRPHSSGTRVWARAGVASAANASAQARTALARAGNRGGGARDWIGFLPATPTPRTFHPAAISALPCPASADSTSWPFPSGIPPSPRPSASTARSSGWPSRAGPRRLTPPGSPPYRTRCCSTISCHPPVPPFLRFDRRPGGHDQVQPTPRPAGFRSESPPLTRGAVAKTFLFCDV